MRTNILKCLGWTLICIVSGVLLVIPSIISAQEQTDTVSLGISPQLLDLTANRGETLQNTFRLTNASAATVDIVTTPKNFTPRGEEGAVDLTIDSTNFSLADWISVQPERVVIEPGQTQDFDVTIDVPENAESGSHFGSVVFQTVPPEDETADALVSQEIAPVILVKISGETFEAADIEEFKTDNSSYGSNPTVSFISRIENTGNVHFKPTGKITIKNMWGDEVEVIELDRRNVLPDSIRQFTSEWNPEGTLFGRYSATLTVVYGDNDEIKTAETSFYIVPWKIIIPVVLVTALVVFVFIKFNKRLLLAAKVLSGKENSDKEE